MSILKKIEAGDSKTLELKETLPKGDAIAKTVTAFSNTSGGMIIIGVNDKREIVGIDPETDIFELQDRITSMIYDACYPGVTPEISSYTIDDKVLIVIEVYRGNLLPYYIKKAGKHEGVYLRVGAANRKASMENIQELERQRRNISFDQVLNKEIALESLNLDPLREKFEQAGKKFDKAVMRNLKLIGSDQANVQPGDQTTDYPTNGLLILLGQYYHAQIRCSRFKGTRMDVFLDQKEYTGDLFSQLENTEQFIKNHISLRSEIKTLQRVDQFEIPEEAIRESLVKEIVA